MHTFEHHLSDVEEAALSRCLGRRLSGASARYLTIDGSSIASDTLTLVLGDEGLRLEVEYGDTPNEFIDYRVLHLSFQQLPSSERTSVFQCPLEEIVAVEVVSTCEVGELESVDYDQWVVFTMESGSQVSIGSLPLTAPDAILFLGLPPPPEAGQQRRSRTVARRT